MGHVIIMPCLDYVYVIELLTHRAGRYYECPDLNFLQAKTQEATIVLDMYAHNCD